MLIMTVGKEKERNKKDQASFGGSSNRISSIKTTRTEGNQN
jgi:hypothetical protein